MSWYDTYLSASGLTPDTANTLKRDQYTLETYSRLAKYLLELKSDLNREYNRNQIARMKETTRVNAEVISAFQKLADTNVDDINGVRTAASRIVSSLGKELHDIERATYSVDWATVQDVQDSSKGVMGFESAVAAFVNPTLEGGISRS